MRWLVFIVVMIVAGVVAHAITFGRKTAFLGTSAVRTEAEPGEFSPTNISGVVNHGWWVADGQFNTNASGLLSNWFDSGVSPNNLTNTGVTTLWPTLSNSVLNGHSVVHFDSGDYLKSINYTNAQPHEMVMVMRYNWPASSARYMFDSAFSDGRHTLIGGATAQISVNGGAASMAMFDTNRWLVVNAVFDGASSALFTNGISSGAKSLTSQAMNGFTLGATYTLASHAPMAVAELLTYSTPLGAIDAAGVFTAATARYDLYNYLTNKYGITQLAFNPSYAVVQSTNKDHAATTQGTVNPPAAFTAGNLQIVACRVAPGVTVSSLTNSQGETYVLAGTTNDASNRIYVYYLKNCAAGVNTVGFTLSGSSTLRMIVAEFSGGSTTDPFDQKTNWTSNDAEVAGWTMGNLVTGYQNQLIVCVGGMDGSGQSANAGTGYTMLQVCPANPAAKLALQYQISDAGTYAGDMGTNPNDQLTGIFATFR